MIHLSKTHLICKNTVDTLLVQSSQPVETLQLVLLERGHEHLRLRDGELASEGRRILEVELVRIDLRNVRLHLERPRESYVRSTRGVPEEPGVSTSSSARM